MRATIIIITILLSFSSRLTAQTRTIYGRVISEEVEVVPGAGFYKDGLLVGKTGIDGRFKIVVSQETQTLSLFSIGFEPTTIKLNSNCDTLEIVMLSEWTYDFISSGKIDRLRLRRFQKLPKIRLQAYNNGLFAKRIACYSTEFEPHKPRLDAIQKEDIKKGRQIKLTFERLNLGDTIKIPFSGEYREDGTDRTTLNFYSCFSDQRNYDCIIKCVILDKNRHKRGYNLACKVVNCDRYKSPAVFKGNVMKIGEVFTYNMKYFKILDE